MNNKRLRTHSFVSSFCIYVIINIKKIFLRGVMDLLQLQISEFLAYCDMNGEEALDSNRIEALEGYIQACNDSLDGESPLVVDAIYDRLYEILKKANPNSELLKTVWSKNEEVVDKDDYYSELLLKEPMKSIMTCKSFDCSELADFIKRLPDDEPFDIHTSVKENGHGVRLVYLYGFLEKATSRGRSTAGRDITEQVRKIIMKNTPKGEDGLEYIESIADYPIFEIRGEILLPLDNLSKAREYNPKVVSAFTGVSSMLRASATIDEVELLDFVAYKVVSHEVDFRTKQEEYSFIENLGFKVPLYWVGESVLKADMLDYVKQIVADAENEVVNGEEPYEYYTDGLVVELDNRELFNSLGADGGKYSYGNVALKIGYWEQDMYYGYIQTILWKDGKTKYSPVAIVADKPDMAEYIEGEKLGYISSPKQISNWNEIGVLTAAGNKVRNVPLYEPNNLLVLDVGVGDVIYFRYGGEAGVVPCFSDGKLLADGKIKQMLLDD